jgi:hypothetical protein
MSKKNLTKLKKFIKDNSLSFTGTGSDLNGNCTIIAGYADFLGETDDINIIKAIKEDFPGISITILNEISRVFDFAYTYNYGNFWKTEAAKKQYKF